MKATRKKKKVVYTNMWTDSDVELLKTLMKQGRNANECSRKLRRTATAIRFKAFKLQISFLRRGKPTIPARRKRR